MSESPLITSSRRTASNSNRRSESPVRVYWRKGFTFGLGQRSAVENVTGRGSPPPGTYNINSLIGDYLKGPLLRGNANVQFSLRRVANQPGPGYYDPYEPLGSNAPKYSMKPKNLLKQRSKSPGPSNYFPNFRTTQNTQFAGIQFGFCDKERTKSSLRKRQSPGPGSYEIPSIFGDTMVNFSPCRD